MRWTDNRHPLDLWCQSVGRPVFEPRRASAADVAGMRILSWNVHVGAGRVEALLPQLLEDASRDGLGLTILLQETFRAGDAVPETYPAGLRVPKAIRPRRPAMDVRGIATQFGLSVAYVPSMRNGSAAALTEREDRGNAILSTEPLLDARAIELPFGKQRRVAVTALVPARGSHLNSRGGLKDQAVQALASRIPLASCGTGRTNRWPLRLDVLFAIGRLDFMFAAMDEGEMASCETLPDAYDSDHLPLLMTLRY